MLIGSILTVHWAINNASLQIRIYLILGFFSTFGRFSPEGDFPSPSSEVAWLTLSFQAATDGVNPRSAATSLQPPPRCSCLGCGKDERSAQWCREEITQVLGKVIKPMVSCSPDQLQVNTSVLPPAHLPCSTFTSKSNHRGQCPAKIVLVAASFFWCSL